MLGSARAEVARQIDRLQSVRNRATAGLTVSALVAGLVGPKLLPHPSGYSIGAVVAVAMTTCAAMLTLYPWQILSDVRLEPLLDWSKDFAADEDARARVALKIAARVDANYKLNNGVLKRLDVVLKFVLFGLGIQLILWLAAFVAS
jgi:hypothetical protein